MFVISQAVREWHLLDSLVSSARRLIKHLNVVIADTHGRTNTICLSLFIIIPGIILIIRNLITEE